MHQSKLTITGIKLQTSTSLPKQAILATYMSESKEPSKILGTQFQIPNLNWIPYSLKVYTHPRLLFPNPRDSPFYLPRRKKQKNPIEKGHLSCQTTLRFPNGEMSDMGQSLPPLNCLLFCLYDFIYCLLSL